MSRFSRTGDHYVVRTKMHSFVVVVFEPVLPVVASVPVDGVFAAVEVLSNFAMLLTYFPFFFKFSLTFFL